MYICHCLIKEIMEKKNVLGTILKVCSLEPLTGYFRNGYCDTDDTDLGKHTVCIIANNDFLKFSILTIPHIPHTRFITFGSHRSI